jgi:hypothetical protein
MSEKPKEKPKSKGAPSSFLTPEDSSSFLYNTPLAIEQVIQALHGYEKSEDDLKHTIVITPVSQGYEFRCDIITPGIMRPRLSAYAVGRLWQTAEENTILEGTIHVDISTQDILMITAMSLIPIPFLLLLPIALFTIAAQRNDARLLKSNMAQAAGQPTNDPVASAHSPREEKG